MDKDPPSHNHSCDYDRDSPKAVSYSRAIADTHGCGTLGIKKFFGMVTVTRLGGSEIATAPSCYG
nr:hypothetical protein Itr_chr02CG16040 [Ipomoea trifida]